MEQNNIFSLKRLANLLRRYSVLNFKAVMFSFLALAGILSIIGALASLHSRQFNNDVFLALFFVAFFITGYFFTSGVFAEFHRPERSIHYISLPASNFEKLLSAWLSTTLIFWVLSIALFYVSFFLSSLLAYWWAGVPLGQFNLFQAKFFKISIIYLVTQPVFFFGAIYFKGYNLLKTLLSLFVLLLFLSLYQTLIGAVVFNDIFADGFQKWDIEGDVQSSDLEGYMQTTFVPMMKIVFYYIVPVFFLTLSYVKIKEREV